MNYEEKLLKLLQQTKEKVGESSEEFTGWFFSLPQVWQNQIYSQLLPRSQGFMPDPEEWVNKAVLAIKILTLKQRILRGLRADRFAFFVNGSEIRECFIIDEALKEWAFSERLLPTTMKGQPTSISFPYLLLWPPKREQKREWR